MKFSYATLITTENYLEGAALLAKSLQNVKSAFPLIVLVTDNINDNKINVFDWSSLNVIIKKVKRLEFYYDYKIYDSEKRYDRYKDTINKFYTLTLLDYDRVMFLDADCFVYQNLDLFFYQKEEEKFIPSIIPELKKITSCSFMISPDLELFNNLIYKNQFFRRCLNDEIAIGLFYDNLIYLDYYPTYKFEERLILDYQIFRYCFHCGGKVKYWEVLTQKEIDELFFLDKYGFRDFIDKYFNTFSPQKSTL